MNQISLFDGEQPLKITKPIRLIELFAGYGSQALALKYLGVPFQSWAICEWAIKSIQAYKDIHFGDDNTDYSKAMSEIELNEYLFNKGISSNYNEPMTFEQINRLNESAKRKIYNNIVATNNFVNIQQLKGENLEITDTDKYTYLMTYSFPCQDLSLAGNGKGMAKGDGTRSGMLWEVERILDELNRGGQQCLPQILLMENVPQVHSEDNKQHFYAWCNKLESLGYKNYWQDLNAKDYGVPQNRDRCFMVSALGDYYYDFPAPIKLTKRLKDVLEKNVDEKFYLSDVALNGVLNTTYNCSTLEARTEKDGIIPTICARDYKDPKLVIEGEPKCEQVAQIESSGYTEMTGRVYSANGLSPTVRTFAGGNTETKIAVPTTTRGKDIVGALRATQHKNGKRNILRNMQDGAGYEGIIEPIVYDGFNQQIRKDQSVIGTLTRNCGADLKRNGQGIIEPIAYDEQNQYLRQDGCVGTLTTDGSSPKHNNRIVEPNLKTKMCNELIASGAVKENDVIRHSYTNSRMKGEMKDIQQNNISPTLDTRCDCLGVVNNYRIRKLTPRECGRLMGVRDDDITVMSKNQSNSSLYHLYGDSIVVDVLMAIIGMMI